MRTPHRLRLAPDDPNLPMPTMWMSADRKASRKGLPLQAGRRNRFEIYLEISRQLISRRSACEYLSTRLESTFTVAGANRLRGLFRSAAMLKASRSSLPGQRVTPNHQTYCPQYAAAGPAPSRTQPRSVRMHDSRFIVSRHHPANMVNNRKNESGGKSSSVRPPDR
jgi:hypothetical protein